MNLFRLLGDMLHLLSICLLLYKIRKNRNVIGISSKTQELYVLVFITRYLDLFRYYISFYNSFMKVAFLASSIYIVYLIRFKRPFCITYEPSADGFPYLQFLVAPCAVLALIINEKFDFFEILWTFSIYLEAVAILPQLSMLQKQGEVENITSHYVGALGAYRAFYILNWFYRYIVESHSPGAIAILAGIVQTVVYGDFFYYYFKARAAGKIMSIPT